MSLFLFAIFVSFVLSVFFVIPMPSSFSRLFTLLLPPSSFLSFSLFLSLSFSLRYMIFPTLCSFSRYVFCIACSFSPHAFSHTMFFLSYSSLQHFSLVIPAPLLIPVIRISPVILAVLFTIVTPVIPAFLLVIPAFLLVIPAKAGIQTQNDLKIKITKN